MRKWIAKLLYREAFVTIEALKFHLNEAEASLRRYEEEFKRGGRLITLGHNPNLREDSPPQ